MDEKKLEALKTLMEKIHETMRISKEKQALIEEKEKKLYEETRIMMVEKGKAELEDLKKDKKEFDEMTIPALISAKKQILQIKKEIEKEYIQYQLDGQKLEREKEEKIKEISDKRKFMIERNSGNEEMIEQIKNTSQRAQEKLDKEYEGKEKLFDARYENIEEAISATNTWEPEIDKYSLELDAADKVQADAEREIKEEAERKVKEQKHYEDLAKKLEEQAHYEDLAAELEEQAKMEREQEEQAHYEDLAAELEEQAKIENEQDKKENYEDLAEELLSRGNENTEFKLDLNQPQIVGKKQFIENNNPEVKKSSPDSANLENEGKPKIEKNVLNNENKREDEGSVVETTRDNEKDEDEVGYDKEELADGDDKEFMKQKEEKKGFFKRIFDKIKEIIKKVVTTVKNGFAKLTSKEVKALESAKEKIEEQDEIVPEELEEQAEELEAQVEERDGLRAEVNVRDDKEVMDRIKATEDKFRQEGEGNPQRMDLEQPDKSDLEETEK